MANGQDALVVGGIRHVGAKYLYLEPSVPGGSDRVLDVGASVLIQIGGRRRSSRVRGERQIAGGHIWGHQQEGRCESAGEGGMESHPIQTPQRTQRGEPRRHTASLHRRPRSENPCQLVFEMGGGRDFSRHVESLDPG